MIYQLSIIVPIYNTPIDKLQRCFMSIENIRIKSYECILVDDGSDDEIGRYLSHYAAKSEEFKYILKKNGGVSSARNIGTMNASGEYVCFVDSDDAIEPTTFDSFLSRQSSEDIIFTDLLFVNGNKKTKWTVFDTENITYEKMIQRMLVNGEVNGPCCKFIRRMFLTQHNIFFDENMIIAEDRAFLLDILKEKPMMFYMKQISYYYFWENVSGKERLRKNPQMCLQNLEMIYFKDKLCIDKMYVTNEEKAHYYAREEEQYIKDVFNMVLEMIEYKLNVHKFERNIKKSLSIVNASTRGMKTKIRKFLLLKKKWRIMKILAFVRRRYLTIKII